MAEITKLSRDAYDRLARELEDLTTRGRVEIAHKIEAARELGDLSENGDYHAAKEEQGKMEGRIGQLSALLRDVEIVEGSPPVVTIRYEGDDQTETYLVGSIEERHDGLDVISPESPLGSQLVDAVAGDSVKFEAPSGKVITVEIVAVET